MMAETAIAEPVDAEVVDEGVSAPSRELVRQEATLTVAPQVGASELVARLDTIREAMQTAMKANVDYGVIPGTRSKPTLLKPGAEKLSALFQLDVQLLNEKHWDGPHLTVISKATVFHAPTGARLGYGEGLCSTREKKYAFRNDQRACPQCGKPAIIKGKAEYGGGWVCFKRKDGCGAKFDDGDPSIESQPVGQIENPDLADTWNTVIKMAEKRARVDAVLAVTGASALFTQDVEDGQDPPIAEEPSQDPRLPHGPECTSDLAKDAGPAASRIASGGPEGGRALWLAVKERCGGYVPEAAALALIEAAKVLPAPLDGDDRGDAVPGEQEPLPEADPPPTDVTEAAVAGLADEVLTAWIEAGVSEREANDLVQGCLRKRQLAGRWNSLQDQMTKARETRARKEAIQ